MQQRQIAAYTMLAHPVAFLLLIFLFLINYLITCALAAGYTTRPYFEKAGRTWTGAWLWTGEGRCTGHQQRDDRRGNREYNIKDERDTILITKYDNRVIGILVLYIIHTKQELCGHIRDAIQREKLCQNNKLLIRAGVGKNLLQTVIRIYREREVIGPVFSDCHANEVLLLPIVFNAELIRRENWARDYLERVKKDLRVNPAHVHYN
ncbi:hypothetical protein BO71DRAFT_419304 [Aspergillus ellipticus CBS 707.79]|uniref:Uncharacterized protein n=1 Tax=Aspergillus ellipticus CBS 707.79 TaxID=1448320 RepID=A0A319E1M0_9EURO|nr:hypothetical protein BO71DRAFT_419304 [Aspergillus ellipticus CBS 707.79]